MCLQHVNVHVQRYLGSLCSFRYRAPFRLKVTRDLEQTGWDIDDYADAAYADMETRAYPFLASPSRYAEFEKLGPPPRREEYPLGEEGRC